MNYPEFSVTLPVVFGCGALSTLGEKVKELDVGDKVLVICDKGIFDSDIVQRACESLATAGISGFPYAGVMSDPTDEIVDEAAALAKQIGVKCVIGIGGGSSMDTAKAVAIALELDKPASEFILHQPQTYHSSTKVVLVPTTAGTGSEVTAVAIISRPELNAKWSAFTYTDLAIVDPELTLSLPKGITANTGLDALAHAAEAMTTVNHNAHSDLFGEAAIRKIANWLPIAYAEPSNIEARTEMMLAANWAGFAFNNPITHVGHAIADALSVAFHTPHGYNCAIALPEAIRIVAPVMPDTARVIAAALGLPFTDSDSAERVGEIIADGIRSLMRKVEIKSLEASGFSRESVLALAADVAGNHLSDFCPVKITEDVARALLERVYDTYR